MARLGIDVAKDSLQLHLITDAGRSASRKCANKPEGYRVLFEWLAKQEIALSTLRVGLEATGGYEEAVATCLADQGCTVYVLNPFRVKHWAVSELQYTKTDAVDARTIADYLNYAKRLHRFRPVLPAYRELQKLVRMREELKATCTAWQNRLGAPGQPQSVLDLGSALLRDLADQMMAIEAEIARVLAAHPALQEAVQLAESIPGIGYTTATTLVGELGDCSQYTHGGAVVASAGLAVVHTDSGTSVHGRPRLSKRGNARVRKALYLPALSARRCDPMLVRFAERLLKNGKKKMQVIAAIMRKLLERFAAVLRTRQPFDPAYQWTLVR